MKLTLFAVLCVLILATESYEQKRQGRAVRDKRQKGPFAGGGSGGSSTSGSSCTDNVYDSSLGITIETSSFEDLGLSDDELAEKVLALWEGNTCPLSATAVDDGTDGKCDSDTTRINSYYKEHDVTFRGSDYLMVISNQIPDHCSGVDIDEPNADDTCEHFVTMLIPKSPSKGDTLQEWPMGRVGLANVGGAFYNHKSAGDCNAAATSETASFDSCLGHDDDFSSYHYHRAPSCIDGYDDCILFGYLQDGYPMHGECTLTMNDGTTLQMTSSYKQTSGDGCATDDYTYDSSGATGVLDAANGYEFEQSACSQDGKTCFGKGDYVYFFTDEYPHTTPGYYGTDGRPICAFSLDDLS